MDIKNFGNPVQSAKDQAQGLAGKLTEQVTELTAAAQEQLNVILEEYQKVLPMAESLGLRVGSFKLEMGLVPEIKTSLIGSVENINKEAVQKLIADHPKNQLLVTILNALLVTKDLQHKLNIKYLKGIQVDIKLGISPNVSVHLTP
jgi:hypothetical protein